jgi:hypothetical protein
MQVLDLQGEKMLSGQIYDGDSLETSNRVLTWHDEAPYRFWIASNRTQSGSQVIQSFEIQQLKAKVLKPSQEEQKSRLKLISNASESSSAISAGELRRLPLGEILMERAELLMATLQRESRRKDSVILIHESKARDSAIKSQASKNLSSAISGANSDDAILVAKIYVDQCNISTVRAAQRTADYLGVDTNLVHVALKIARRNKWLTSSGSGKAGGQLTEKGLLEFNVSQGPEREKSISKKRGNN